MELARQCGNTRGIGHYHSYNGRKLAVTVAVYVLGTNDALTTSELQVPRQRWWRGFG